MSIPGATIWVIKLSAAPMTKLRLCARLAAHRRSPLEAPRLARSSSRTCKGVRQGYKYSVPPFRRSPYQRLLSQCDRLGVRLFSKTCIVKALYGPIISGFSPSDRLVVRRPDHPPKFVEGSGSFLNTLYPPFSGPLISEFYHFSLEVTA
jgi:hypothetical protein